MEGPAAVGLLAGALPDLAGLRPEAGPDVSLVTLVVDLPQLDARPRGTGVLVAPQSPGIQAKALTHATAKWEWLADQAGPGTHVVRLSYGRGDARHGAQARPEPRTDDELFEAALKDASTLLSVPVTAGDVVDWDVVRWGGALPFASLGHKRRVAEVRQHLRGGRHPGRRGRLAVRQRPRGDRCRHPETGPAAAFLSGAGARNPAAGAGPDSGRRIPGKRGNGKFSPASSGG